MAGNLPQFRGRFLPFRNAFRRCEQHAYLLAIAFGQIMCTQELVDGNSFAFERFDVLR